MFGINDEISTMTRIFRSLKAASANSPNNPNSCDSPNSSRGEGVVKCDMSLAYLNPPPLYQTLLEQLTRVSRLPSPGVNVTLLGASPQANGFYGRFTV